MINIVELKEHEPDRLHDVYIGPGSSLQNPFRRSVDGTPGDCQQQHEKLFKERYKQGLLTVPEKTLLNRILTLHEEDYVNLMCTCPVDDEFCHGHLIKRFTEMRLEKKFGEN